LFNRRGDKVIILLAAGDIVGVSESSMSIIVAEVSTVVAKLKNEFLFLPKDEEEI
jgi:hypothetical protein